MASRPLTKSSFIYYIHIREYFLHVQMSLTVCNIFETGERRGFVVYCNNITLTFFFKYTYFSIAVHYILPTMFFFVFF